MDSQRQNADVCRVRLKGVRHPGLADLLLMDGPERSSTVGEGGPATMIAVANDAVLALLGVY